MIPIFKTRAEVIAFYSHYPEGRSKLINPKTNKSAEVNNRKEAIKAMARLKLK
ncbi:hypothetical protein [Vibrio phage D4]|nr:hypothetical protein [Vibrio phage D4]WKV32769.1 hypothetical protein R21Y_8 [Vibrio phage vB_VhaS_R21Y]